MLEEYRALYEEQANFIPEWRKIDKNTLCNLYLDEEDEFKKQCYLSAIIYKYWSLISSLHNKTKLVCTEEDCYDTLIASITYALDRHRWRSEDSTLYNDPNGPDKSINVRVKCLGNNLLKTANYQKRKSNVGILSLDTLSEEYDDLFIPSVSDDLSMTQSLADAFIENVISTKNKSYVSGKLSLFSDDSIYDNIFVGMVLDIILRESIFDNELKFSMLKFSKVFRTLGDDFVDAFSCNYDIDYKIAEQVYKYYLTLSNEELYIVLDDILDLLKNEPAIKEMLNVN